MIKNEGNNFFQFLFSFKTVSSKIMEHVLRNITNSMLCGNL